MFFGGESPTFWAALILTTIVKWLFSEKTSLKQAVGGVVAGMIVAYFGHDFVIKNIGFLTKDDDIVVSIVLVLTSEHITRALLTISPEKALKMWRGK